MASLLASPPLLMSATSPLLEPSMSATELPFAVKRARPPTFPALPFGGFNSRRELVQLDVADGDVAFGPDHVGPRVERERRSDMAAGDAEVERLEA